VPVAVATYLINEKREWLRTLEDKSEAELIIVPNENIQTPEYSIRRVRDDEMELPEQKQATYLMPTAPEVAEPGSARDSKPPAETPAVIPLLPATAAPVAVPPPAAAPAVAAPAHLGFWSRVRKILSGEPPPAATAPIAAQEAAAPARTPRRDDQQRRDGRRDHPRHTRYADGARRERSDGRRGEGRDRDRMRDNRDRGRDPTRRHERSADRGERDADRNSTERSAPQEARAPGTSGPAPGAPGQLGEARGERGERGEPGERGEGRGRGRRGRRRGRRGGGGARESAPTATPSESSLTVQATDAPDAAGSGNGSHESAAAAAAPEREPPVREHHGEAREAGTAHEAAPLAHFEPTPKAESGQNKPYVVWSSAPPKEPGGREPEE
jgi:ribonuclease E